MDDEFDTGAAMFVTMTFDVRIVRIMETQLIPSKLKMRTDFTTDQMGSVEMTAALLRVKLWVDSIVNGSIAFGPENVESYGMFFDAEGKRRASNNIILTPGDPTDDVLATVFTAKFNALADGVAVFEMCEIESDNAFGLRFTFVGDTSEFLPPMSEWIGERTYFELPWWNRNDASSYDMIPPEGADVSEKPDWAWSIVTGLEDLSETAPPDPTPSIVIRPNFRPQVIDGGKKPDHD